MHSPVNHMPHPRFFLTREETRYTHALLGVQTVTCRKATTPQIQGMPGPPRAGRATALPVTLCQ